MLATQGEMFTKLYEEVEVIHVCSSSAVHLGVMQHRDWSGGSWTTTWSLRAPFCSTASFHIVWDRNESSNHALLLCKPLRSSLIPPAEAPTTIRSVTQRIMCWEIAQNQWFLGLRTWAPKLGLGDFKLENHWWKNKGCAISRLESRVE